MTTGVKTIEWTTELAPALARAGTQHKAVMVDFYADWCAACKEYDALTFSEPRVITALQSLVTVKLDFTVPTEQQDQLAERYNLVGLPTILFLQADGSEIPDSRLTGFLGPDEFLAHLAKLRK